MCLERLGGGVDLVFLCPEEGVKSRATASVVGQVLFCEVKSPRVN